jgi:hypothetical protein
MTCLCHPHAFAQSALFSCQSFCFVLFSYETGFHWVPKARLQFAILLPLPPSTGITSGHYHTWFWHCLDLFLTDITAISSLCSHSRNGAGEGGAILSVCLCQLHGDWICTVVYWHPLFFFFFSDGVLLAKHFALSSGAPVILLPPPPGFQDYGGGWLPLKLALLFHFLLFSQCFEIGSPFIAWPGLELTSLLPPPPSAGIIGRTTIPSFLNHDFQ